MGHVTQGPECPQIQYAGKTGSDTNLSVGENICEAFSFAQQIQL